VRLLSLLAVEPFFSTSALGDKTIGGPGSASRAMARTSPRTA
jgi:hypothetical protein